jgi:ABC-type transport system involved in multi-copper enzyme maturation permease subunit
MSDVISLSAPTDPGRRVAPSQGSTRYGIKQTLRAEMIKLRSLRSTRWTMVAVVAGSLLVTFLATQHIRDRGRNTIYHFDPTNQSLTGLALGSLAIGVLGVLAITAEYGSGTIRSSLAATPRRPLFLAGKAMVVGFVTLVVGEVMTFACFFLGQGILSGNAPTATLGQSGVFEALVLSGAYLALLGLFGMGLGLIIRNTAGAIAAFVGFTFLLPLVLQPLNADGNPARFTPEQILANSVAAVVHQTGQLSPVTGFLWMVFYCAVTLVVGALVLSRRDA